MRMKLTSYDAGGKRQQTGGSRGLHRAQKASDIIKNNNTLGSIGLPICDPVATGGAVVVENFEGREVWSRG